MMGSLFALAASCAPSDSTPQSERPPAAIPIRLRFGGLLTLITDAGAEVRLAGLAPPEAVHGPRAQSLVDALAGVLADIVARGPCRLSWSGSPEPDRWGRWPALITPADSNTTVQERVLAEGLARCAPEVATRRVTGRLLAAEARARGAGLGVWGMSAYAVRSPLSMDDTVGGYHVVQGRVGDVRFARGRVTLSFTPRGWGGFRVGLTGEARRAWGDGDALGLQGAVVRARGPVTSDRYGPRMRLLEAGQLELVFART